MAVAQDAESLVVGCRDAVGRMFFRTVEHPSKVPVVDKFVSHEAIIWSFR